MRRKCVLPVFAKHFVNYVSDHGNWHRSHLIPFNGITGYKSHIKAIRFILLPYQLSIAKPRGQRRQISRRTTYFTDRLITVDERNDRFRLLPIARERSKKQQFSRPRKPIAIMQELMNTDTRRIRSEVSNHSINFFFPLFSFSFFWKFRRSEDISGVCSLPPSNQVEIQARMYPRRITILVTGSSHYIRPVRRVFPTWRLPVLPTINSRRVPSLTGLSVVLCKFNSCRSWPPIMSFHLGSDSRCCTPVLCTRWPDWFRDHEKTFSSISRWCVPRMPRRRNYLDDSAPGFMGSTVALKNAVAWRRNADGEYSFAFFGYTGFSNILPQIWPKL